MDLSERILLGENSRRTANRDPAEAVEQNADPALLSIARLAVIALGAKSAAISAVDGNSHRLLASVGMSASERGPHAALCEQTLREREMLIIPNVGLERRFVLTPPIEAGHEIGLFAGMPLLHGDAECIGALCVFDPNPRKGLTAEQYRQLRDLASIAARLLLTSRYEQSQEIAQKALRVAEDAVVAWDDDGIILSWNAGAEALFGHKRLFAEGKQISLIMPERLAPASLANLAFSTLGQTSPETGKLIQMTGARADGSEFPLKLTVMRWDTGHGVSGSLAVMRDATGNKLINARNDPKQQSFLEAVVSNLPVMLFAKDARTRRYMLLNKAGERVTGLAEDEVVGKTDAELFPEYAEGFAERDSRALSQEEPFFYESEFISDEGVTTRLRTTRIALDLPNGGERLILGIAEDLTERRKAEAEVFRLAHYDTLTGLNNRASFTNLLHEIASNKQRCALMIVDLDRFKGINDQFGHLAGDSVLSEVGQRLLNQVEPGDHVARIGGDKFAIVLAGEKRRQRANAVAADSIKALSDAFVTSRGSIYLGASVGIALFPDDAASPDELRENADLALYRGKSRGTGLACWFSPQIDNALSDRRKLTLDLRGAIDKEEISVWYQPVLRARTGEIVGMEALARWNHPIRGMIKPEAFIGLAEEMGMIEALGETVLRQACKDAVKWPLKLNVAVNLSPLQFQTGDLLPVVRSALEESGLDPNRLELEVTEGLVLKDVQRTFDQLEELRELGIRVLIDDFGVGYSSLSYFQRFAFDKVKIDRSFVQGVENTESARAIIQAVVGLGRELRMATVAEGVETESQMRALVDLGCTHLQGYLFSPPIPASEAASLMEGPSFCDMSPRRGGNPMCEIMCERRGDDECPIDDPAPRDR